MTKTEYAIRKAARRLIWIADYPTNERREHNHRCRACWRIMEPGQSARWFRLRNGKSWVVHSNCEHTKHSPKLTWKRFFWELAVRQIEDEKRR